MCVNSPRNDDSHLLAEILKGAAALIGSRGTELFHVIKIEKSHNVVSMTKACMFLESLEHCCDGVSVSPPTFGSEPVPDEDIKLGETPTILKAPFKNIFVRATEESALAQRVVLDSKKTAAFPVESLSKKFEVWRRKYMVGMQPNLAQHSSEINHSTDLYVCAARRFIHAEQYISDLTIRNLIGLGQIASTRGPSTTMFRRKNYEGARDTSDDNSLNEIQSAN
jgi:hypothetical protein